MMRYIILLLIITCNCNIITAKNRVMKEMCNRLFPEYSESFIFDLLPNDTIPNDYFAIESINGKIQITGNCINSLATGLNHYLKYYCNTHVSWYAFDKVEMPKTLPSLPHKVTITARCEIRFFLNYCTFGYTMPYWKWKDWERLIDWMALNGVNMPLAITGQEAIWYDVWKEMGLKDLKIRSYFTGPAHLPWHRMSNVDYWQSPLPTFWIKQQKKLQKQIVNRERALGMTPVLPAFSGHVPAELKKIYPNASISPMSQWGGYDEKYRSHFIEPMDPLFAQIQKSYLKKQTKLYGTDHIYGIDPFNEVDSPDWNKDFLRTVSDKIFRSIESVDSLARWVQMTWMFYHSKDKWSQPRIEAFLNSVPNNKLVLLDYYCDSVEIWRETERYYGKPYVWCYLGNFGGNSMLAGNIDDISNKLERLFIEGGKNVNGIGATLEGFDVNPLMYEFVLEKAWNHSITNSEWVRRWALRRGGQDNHQILDAWDNLYTKIYVHHSTAGQSVLMNARPKLEGTDSWNTYPDIHYDNKDLWNIWYQLLSAKEVNSVGYRFDVINIGRQVLGNLFSDFRASFTDCYHQKDIEGMKKWAAKMDGLLKDVDRLLSCETSFSIGKWIRDARDWGNSNKEKDYYEQNARCILTTWGQKATQLNDYANRGWGGLTNSYYRKRWKLFTEYIINEVLQEREADEKDFYDQITEFEYQWTLQKESFPELSGEEPVKVANALYIKYKKYFDK